MIKVRELVKRLGGREVLQGISFTVEPRRIYGLIGPNGAGKTTTLRVVAGLLKPTRGVVEVLGVDVQSGEFQRIKRKVAYLPEEVSPYDNLTGEEFVEFVHSIYGRNNVKEAVEISGLGARIRDKVKTYSKGMKRRLLFSALLALKTKVLVLDEPTAGIDVEHAIGMRKLIKEFAKSYDMTVLLSSHNMLEVDYVCDEVGIINNGKIITEGSPVELKEEHRASNLEEVFVKLVGWA